MPGGIIGIDPGPKNYALCVLEGGQCIGIEMVQKLIHTLGGKELDTIILRYSDYVREVLNAFRPRAVVIERFIVRGFGSNNIELVTYMVAVLKEVCRQAGIPCYLVSASQWKTTLKKQLDLKALYKQYWKKPYRIPPHKIDSLLIARYLYNDKKFTEHDERWIHETLNRLPESLYPKRRFQFWLAKRVVF
jgi:hypothetical protein